MNGWDIFTYLMCVALGVSAVLIFGFFLKDAGAILRGDSRDSDDEEGEESERD